MPMTNRELKDAIERAPRNSEQWRVYQGSVHASSPLRPPLRLPAFLATPWSDWGSGCQHMTADDLIAEALGDWLTEATRSAYADMEPEELTDWAIVTTRMANHAESPEDRNRAAAVFHAVMTELGRRRLISYGA